ncbi:unnamed protein product [Caenorhabditis angaria]|uniref:Uncharacterized protein n=1 Tax=Caenorhabditis angaria TaxID=860376 RepID=A0A9P1J6C7_9PELO|nr:unnamed protein product [Caenorhabditis angaria]
MTEVMPTQAPYISAKQRLLNDWTKGNIAPIMINGKIVKRKRCGDKNEDNSNAPNSKRSKSTNSNAVTLMKPDALQKMQKVVAENNVGRTFKQRGNCQQLVEKKQELVPKKMFEQKEDEAVVTEEFLMSLDPSDPLGLKLMV